MSDVLRIFLVAALLAGCGDDGTSPDAGFDGGLDAGFDGGFDAGLDSGPEPSEIFGPCVTDEQCPGDGAFCRTAVEDGFPMGQCTRTCPDTGDRGYCDDGVQYHHCLDHEVGGWFCERRCRNGFDCGRTAYTCVGDIEGIGGVCIGVCSEDAHCGGTSECNVWSGQCTAAGGVPTTGSVHGETCSIDDNCRSNNCITAYDGATPTGWNLGYCIGPCILPLGYNTSEWFSGEALPEGTCPDGNICFPNGSFTEGDLGICLKQCASSADCRTEDGYECVKQFGTASGMSAFFTNGVCLPLSPSGCGSADACPAGFNCRSIRTTRGTRYVCEKV